MVVVVIIGLLATIAIPAYRKIRETAIARAMDNDARQLASAAQQYFIEKSTTTVALTYTPATGAIGGDLAPYVSLISKGYGSAIGSPITTAAGPSLQHDLLGPAAVSYAPEGQLR